MHSSRAERRGDPRSPQTDAGTAGCIVADAVTSPEETTLSQVDAAAPAVRAALMRLTRELSPLTDPPPALRRYATAFVDALLDTGIPSAAHKAAARAVQAGRDLPTPPSRGRPGSLRGAEVLETSSAQHRDLIGDVLALLGQLVGSDRSVVPWLFEAVKQWASAERDVALSVLVSLDLSEEDRAAGLAEVLRFAWRSAKDDRGRQILRGLTAAGRDDGPWTLSLLAALERLPSIGERLLSALLGHELGEPLLERPPGWLLRASEAQLAALRRCVGSTVPAVRTIAVVLLAQVPGVDVRDAALALLAEGGWPARHVVGVLNARAAVGPEVAQAIASARARPPEGASKRQLDEYAEGLAALEQSQAAGAAAVVSHADDWTVVVLPALVASPPVVRGERLLLAYHRIVRRAPTSQWMTDEDELGFMSLSLGTPHALTESPLPVRLPPTPTGASGARRRFELATLVGDALVCWLCTPFSDGRGWGNRNYLFAFTPEGARWEVLRPSPAPLAPGAGEAALPSLGYGELVVWEEGGALRFASDGTPYHLDDCETDPETKRNFEARRRAEARLPWATELVTSGDLPTGEDWPLCDGRTLRGARARLVDAWPAAASGRLYALRGAALPDGRVALTIRRFVRGEAPRDALMLAPVEGPRPGRS